MAVALCGSRRTLGVVIGAVAVFHLAPTIVSPGRVDPDVAEAALS